MTPPSPEIRFFRAEIGPLVRFHDCPHGMVQIEDGVWVAVDSVNRVLVRGKEIGELYAHTLVRPVKLVEVTLNCAGEVT